MRGSLLLLPVTLSSALRVLSSGDRETRWEGEAPITSLLPSLYNGPASRGKQGTIITARPSTHKVRPSPSAHPPTSGQLARLKFHLLDCMAGRPCSQAIPGDPLLNQPDKEQVGLFRRIQGLATGAGAVQRPC